MKELFQHERSTVAICYWNCVEGMKIYWEKYYQTLGNVEILDFSLMDTCQTSADAREDNP